MPARQGPARPLTAAERMIFAQARCAVLAKASSRRTTASEPSAMITRIANVATTLRPRWETGRLDCAGMVLTEGRAPAPATGAAPAGLAPGHIALAARRTVGAGCGLGLAPGVCGAAPTAGDAPRIKDEFTFSRFLRSASMDG